MGNLLKNHVFPKIFSDFSSEVEKLMGLSDNLEVKSLINRISSQVEDFNLFFVNGDFKLF